MSYLLTLSGKMKVVLRMVIFLFLKLYLLKKYLVVASLHFLTLSLGLDIFEQNMVHLRLCYLTMGFLGMRTKKMIQCEKQQYEDHCKKNPDAKGLYGISFPHFDTLVVIYGKDIAIGEGAEGLADAVLNMEKEAALEESHDQEVQEDSMSRETPQWTLDRNSVDSVSSSSKRRKRDKGIEVSKSSDPIMYIVGGLRGDFKYASNCFGKMAEAMEHEAKLQEEATHEEPMQNMQKKSVDELTRLGFSGTELIKAASVFVNAPGQMTMLFAHPD